MFTGLVVSAHEESSPSRETSPDLCQTCLSHPPCARVLHFLYSHPTTLMTVGDIAATLGYPRAVIESTIETLGRMGYLRRVHLDDALSFCGITENPEKLQAVRGFQQWCAEQRRERDRVRDLIG